MKHILYAMVILSALCACQREPGYTIQGLIPGTPNGTKAYMYNWNQVLDSAVITDGKFFFRGKVDQPTLYQIWVDLSPEAIELFDKDMRGSALFVDNSDIRYECASIDSLPSRLDFERKVKGKVTVTGSPTHNLYETYRAETTKLLDRNEQIYDQYLEEYHIPAGEGKAFNTRRGIELIRQKNQCINELQEIQYRFITQHPTSPVSLEVSFDMLNSAKLSRAEMDEILQIIDPTLHETAKYKVIKEQIESLYPVAIGEKYTDIELVDQQGKTVHLSDFVKPGQYNMVEFWASWCGPCRFEIPHLRHVYEAYGKELNMISVSVDERDKDWKKALNEEGMNWTQLCDQKGMQGDVATKYHITGVPSSLILDPEGRIIDRDVRGSAMDIVLIDRIGDKFKD